MRQGGARLWRSVLGAVVVVLAMVPGLRAQVVGKAATGVPAGGEVMGGLAPVPPMGWASWNHFFCDYDERTIREQADALVATGMRDAGYRYVVIQECIARERAADGALIADKARFPSGMPALTAYLHERGLKAGIYTDIGRNTCYPSPRYQGSYGHEQQDADTFAAWGMDFVEMDYCNRVEEHTGRWVYERMAEAIRHTGRPMLFYLCAWGNEQPWEWAQGVAQMWRTEYDISLEKNHVEWDRLVRNFESNTVHSVLSGPESWNDADMLEIGNPGLSDAEAEAQMSMWAISPSPLLAGADLVHMSAHSRAVYLNKEVLAINQDVLGAGADKVASPAPGVEIWAKPLRSRTGGEYAVMLLNATGSGATMEVAWTALDLQPGVKARDLWTHRDVEERGETLRRSVPAHAAVLLRVSGTRAWKAGVTIEAEWPGVGREGATTLLACGECSRGYAMSLGGAAGKAGGLRFGPIDGGPGGAYMLRVLYTRNGLQDSPFTVVVNGTAVEATATMRSWNWVDVPVTLRQGENTIELRYDGVRPLLIDNVTLLAGR